MKLERNENITNGPRDVLRHLLGLFMLPPLIPSRRCPLAPFFLSCCSPFPPREQLLAAVVLGAALVVVAALVMVWRWGVVVKTYQ
jgi:hypothetical protein